MQSDASFPTDYECEILEEMPNRVSPQWYFPRGTGVGGRDGLIVSVQPHDGEEWLGIFARGDIAPSGANAVLSMPHPRQLCVVARGQGCIVEVTLPREIEVISMEPILGVTPAPASGLVLMHDFSRVRAYGHGGLAWSAPAISWDGIQLREVSQREAHGIAWDSPNSRRVPFVIDLATGACRGGASPELLKHRLVAVAARANTGYSLARRTDKQWKTAAGKTVLRGLVHLGFVEYASEMISTETTACEAQIAQDWKNR